MANPLPFRPSPDEIDAQYDEARVMGFAKFIAKRATSSRQYDQNVFDDAQSEAILAFYKRVEQYKSGRAILPDTYSFYHWLLFRVLTDVRAVLYRDYRRLRGRAVERIEYTDVEEPVAPDPLAVAMAEEVMSALTPRQRQVIQMYFFENKSQNEIAEELGIAQKNVSKTITRAVRRMRKVEGYEEMGGEA